MRVQRAMGAGKALSAGQSRQCRTPGVTGCDLREKYTQRENAKRKPLVGVWTMNGSGYEQAATRPTWALQPWRGPLEDQYGAFRGSGALDIETLLRDLRLAACHDIIDFGVRMARVMVKEHQALDTRLLRDL